MLVIYFFFNDTATTEIYTLSLHDALPICVHRGLPGARERAGHDGARRVRLVHEDAARVQDRKSTRLNSSHANISYAVFCLKKKKKNRSSSKCTDDKISIQPYYNRATPTHH